MSNSVNGVGARIGTGKLVIPLSAAGVFLALALPGQAQPEETGATIWSQPLVEPPGVPAGAQFSAEQIELLADVPRESCAVFFGGNQNAPPCLRY